ncbi:hypothetical protein [Rhizobium sp. ERR 942]|uniref:hypothetical protein n=1 Tax=Rhizobium sp. ERR 942 TaxID=2572676 RepID=UPI001AED3695|nr:hypothetical protein [Rhizobium sp. ERR 942]
MLTAEGDRLLSSAALRKLPDSAARRKVCSNLRLIFGMAVMVSLAPIDTDRPPPSVSIFMRLLQDRPWKKAACDARRKRPTRQLGSGGINERRKHDFLFGCIQYWSCEEDRLEAAGRKRYQIAIEYGPERV